MQVPGQVQRGSGEGSEVPEKVGEAFVQPGQVQPGSGEGSGEGLGGFGAQARSGSTGFRRFRGFGAAKNLCGLLIARMTHTQIEM